MNDSNQPLEAPIFSHKKGPSKKVAVIIIAIVVLLGAAGAAAYIFRDQLFGEKKTEITSTDGSQREGVDEEAVNKTVAAANTYAINGDTASAAKVLDSAIEKTNSSPQKAVLYSSKAGILGGSDTAAAVKAAEQAVALNPDFANTSLLGQMYEANGNKEKAIEYYEKTIVLYNNMERKGETGSSDAGSYQIRIDRLRGQ